MRTETKIRIDNITQDETIAIIKRSRLLEDKSLKVVFDILCINNTEPGTAKVIETFDTFEETEEIRDYIASINKKYNIDEKNITTILDGLKLYFKKTIR